MTALVTGASSGIGREIAIKLAERGVRLVISGRNRDKLEERLRKILGDTVQYTTCREDYKRVRDLPENADFFRFQNITNPTTQIVPSHNVIENFIRYRGADYRFQLMPNPVPELRDRRKDNTSDGRIPNATDSTEFFCND